MERRAVDEGKMRDGGIRWMFQVSLLDRGCPFVGNGPKYPRLVLFQRSAASVSFFIRLCASRSREQECLYWNAKSREWDTRALDCWKRGRGNLIRNKDEILEKFHRPLCITVPQRVCQARMFFSYQILLDRLIRKIGEPIFLAQATAAYAPMEDASNIFEVSAFRQHDANKIPGNFTSIFEY